jgi:UDP-N-acetylmuramate dehydrogenase
MNVYENYSLKSFHTFGIDVSASYVCEVYSIDEFRSIWLDPLYASLPKLILGEGSNVVFKSNFNGLVIINKIKGFEYFDNTETGEVFCTFLSGENWHEAVVKTLELGFYGLENLSLIPGTVGAAPIQNIGAYGVELKEVFYALLALDLHTMEWVEFKLEDCCFGYRDSIFKQKPRNSYFIYSVTLKLQKTPHLVLGYGDIPKYLENAGIQNIQPKDVSDAVIAIRNSKLPNPKVLGNAGSFFKNPQVTAVEFERIKASYPEIKGFETDEGFFKIPAAWLIENTGWKGKIVGNIGSHKNQALVLVNYGSALGTEVEALALSIQESVINKFGIRLEPEVNII